MFLLEFPSDLDTDEESHGDCAIPTGQTIPIAISTTSATTTTNADIIKP